MRNDAQAYSAGFAPVYNAMWRGFAERAAPLILEFYADTPVAHTNTAVLDLCCGTGQLAVHFLEHGYAVVGIDLSAPMLHYARENARDFLANGQAAFIQGDVSAFSLDRRFGLVVATFDALNHLENEAALADCFRCVRRVLLDGGYLIFDLNTRAGLKRWNCINVEDDGKVTLIIRGIYNGQADKAWTKITGFRRTEGGLYERFEETAYNTVFSFDRVREMLLELGWRAVHFARLEALAEPIAAPEEEARAFIVARK